VAHALVSTETALEGQQGLTQEPSCYTTALHTATSGVPRKGTQAPSC
jgi:hypothetical protein